MSSQISTVCPKCSGAMEFGLLADGTAWDAASERALEWVRGTPKRSFLSQQFKTAKGDRLQVATLRCTSCGFLELYAPAAKEPGVS